MNVEIVDNIEKFKMLEPCWNELLNRSGSDTIHLRHEWLFTFWKYFNKGLDLRIILIKKNKEIIGIAPLVSRNVKIRKIIPVRQFVFLGDGISDWGDFIMSEPREQILQKIFEYLKKMSWNEIILHNIPEASPNLPLLRQLVSENKGIIKEQTKCYFIQIQNKKWEDYFNNETSKKFIRRDLNRLYNHLSQIEWELLASNFENIESDLEIIAKLHECSQNRKDRVSVYAEQHMQNFIKEMISIWHPPQIAKLFFLKIEKEIAAFMLGFFYNSTFYWWNTGLNTKYEKLSPSKILLTEVLKKSFNDGIIEFNFMRGNSEYKTKWTKLYQPNYQMKLYNTDGFMGQFNKLRKLS